MGQAELLVSEKTVLYVKLKWNQFGGNFGYNFREILVATFVANIFGDLCVDWLTILWILFKANLSKRAFLDQSSLTRYSWIIYFDYKKINEIYCENAAA